MEKVSVPLHGLDQTDHSALYILHEITAVSKMWILGPGVQLKVDQSIFSPMNYVSD